MTTPEDPRLARARAISVSEIAERLGIEGLRRTGADLAGPCPVCGGRDRFAIAPKKGVWLCRQCPAEGDGIALVSHVRGLDFKGALAFLCGEVDAPIDPAEQARRDRAAAERRARAERVAEAERARAIAHAREIWRASLAGAGTPAEDYLAGRGIRFPAWPRALRFAPALPYLKKTAGRPWHVGPAMIAGIASPEGPLQAVHITWLDPARPKGKAEIRDPSGAPQAAKLVRGSKKGGAIRLASPEGAAALIMGEGIETTASALTALAAAAGRLPRVAFWAGVDLGNMSGRMARVEGRRWSGEPDLEDARAWLPPPWVRRLLFIQDGDSDRAMTRAKLEAGLARARHHLPGLSTAIIDPGAGVDFNDIITGGGNA